MENKCVYHLSRGNTAKQIAKVLGIGARMVKTYMDNVKQKTGCTLRSELVSLFLNQHKQNEFF